jgi:hypothetical protein
VGISALALISFAWNQAAVVGWSTSYTYVLLIMGLLLVAGVVFIERSANCPLFPVYVMSGDLA